MWRLICCACCVLCAAACGQSGLVQPSDFEYLGAFRLPEGGERPETFAYGGNAMTFRPDGDPQGAGDGFPGTLYIMGHDRLAYGELPDGNQLAEVSIPAPVASKSLGSLNRAAFVQPFTDAARGLFTAYAEIPRVGIEYVDHAAAGPKIHLAWGQHFHEGEEERGPTHAWISPDLAAPDPAGSWYIGNRSLYSVNGYLFEIPPAWAEAHAGGRCLATGRFRDGGWSGQGPCLYAYRPWTDDSGTSAAGGTRLEEVILLEYVSSQQSTDVAARSLKGYQHPDEWEGGAWLTASTGKSAVLFAGTKGTGAKYWYGWVNPDGPDIPCVETAMLNDFTVCRMADGSPCPPEDLERRDNHNDFRGWWSARMTARFILYDPGDLAKVAAGGMKPWEPQPYASLDVDEHLFLNPAGVEEGMLGAGVQRRYRISGVAYDRAHDLLYVLEPFADAECPVVHVWRVR